MQMVWCYWLAMKGGAGRLVESYAEVVCERSCLKGRRVRISKGDDSRQGRAIIGLRT